jgi:hypothetical protein
MKIYSLFPQAVEQWYSTGIYPVITRLLRFLLGWIPFSVGDLIYALVVVILVRKLYLFFRTIVRKEANRAFWWNGLRWLFFWGLFVYTIFNVLWGLNYNRLGIRYQLGLKLEKYKVNDLDSVVRVFVTRLHQYSNSSVAKRQQFAGSSHLFKQATFAYTAAEQQHTWLSYRTISLKPSLFSRLGNYLNYSGYYNPFTGEAQVNIQVPLIMRPFTTCHEIGHQLGYAKEDEANFAGYLSAKASFNEVVRYSLYLDLYEYGLNELYRKDSARASAIEKTIPEQTQKDVEELRAHALRYQNPIEPYTRKLYAQFLRANEQPGGMRSYSEVMAFLVAYYKKFGAAAL